MSIHNFYQSDCPSRLQSAEAVSCTISKHTHTQQTQGHAQEENTENRSYYKAYADKQVNINVKVMVRVITFTMEACFHHRMKNKISNCDFLSHNSDFCLVVASLYLTILIKKSEL